MIYNCEKISGVYEILNTVNSKRYIGSSVNIYARLDRHKQDLKYKAHHSVALARAVAKYGIDKFKFSILVICSPDMCKFYEQLALDNLNCDYNTSSSATSGQHSEETLQKIRIGVRASWTDDRRKRQAEKAKADGFGSVQLSKEARARVGQANSRILREKNRKLQAFGRMWSVKELAEEYSVKYTMLKDRLRAGWSVEDAVLKPKREGGL